MNRFSESNFSDSLLTLAKRYDIPLSAEQVGLFYEHVHFMLEWNRKVNLTRITVPDEILVKHLLDSILPARWLPQKGLALDVGTGPGFPGIPLKILNPGLDMVLLETHRKKISFLRVLLSRLHLENIRAVQGRWEALCKSDDAPAENTFRLIVMRAVRLEPEHLVHLAARLLEPGGIFAWWAGPQRQSNPESLENELRDSGMRFLETHGYTLPDGDASRRLLLWRREK